MKLEDIIKDSYEVERAKETSESISNLMRDGLDRFEKAFKSKFVDIVRERSLNTRAKCDPVELRDYSLGEKCDNFLKKKLQHESKRRKEYYAEVPKSRPSQSGDDENGTLMPPLAMVPKIVYFSEMKKLFAGLKPLEKTEMSGMFGLKVEDITEVIDHFLKIRNSCSHDQGQLRNPKSVFCLKEFVGPRKVQISYKGEMEYLDLKNCLFGTMTLLGHMLSDLPHENMHLSAGEWKHKMANQLKLMPQKVLIKMGFPERWFDHRIWRPSRRKSVHEIGVMYGLNFDVFEQEYNSLDDDIRREVDSRTQFISSRLIENGWDTGDNLIDNIEWTARACVIKSILGNEDDGHGFPQEEFKLARALANGSENADDQLNGLNDFYAERVYNDSFMMLIPKGSSDEFILKKIERWMRFDKKRRDSNFHESFLFQSIIVRKPGSIIGIKDIFPVLVSPFIMNIAEESFDNFRVNSDNCFQHMNAMLANRAEEIPEWYKMLGSKEHRHKVFDIFRRILMNRIGENGVVSVVYSDLFKGLYLWPDKMLVDLNKANADFKREIEEGYKFRDPEKLGCDEYEAPFHYPLMLETEMEEKLLEKMPTENPFGSIDNAFCYSYRYYHDIIKRVFLDKLSSSINKELGIQFSDKVLFAKSTKNIEMILSAAIMLGDDCLAESESKIPIEMDIKEGKLHLNTGRMHRACVRESKKLKEALDKNAKKGRKGS